MAQTQSKGARATLVIATIALVISIAAVGYAYAAQTSLSSKPLRAEPQTRGFTVVSTTANFDDEAVGIPHDIFVPTQIIVNQGDKVIIHFYNTEDKPENHTFTLLAYNINVDLGMGQKQDISFVANQAGTFPFVCTYHLPTMVGQLVVLPA